MFKVTAAFLIVLGAVSGFESDPLKQLLLHKKSNRSDYVNCRDPCFTNITLSLYTRENPVTPIILTYDTINKLNKDRQYKIIIHGWLKVPEWMLDMKDNYLKKAEADYNVIKVDWSNYSLDPYPTSVCFLPKIAKLITPVIVERFDLSKLHFIGHSLGAQLSGLIGHEVYKESGKKLNRITGLDAAGPWFSGLTDKHRISPDDAEFVDAIHSNAGALGINHAYGQVNFYPNGGKMQMGCKHLGFGFAEKCSHGRSPLFMLESINSEKFVATFCTSYGHYKTSRCDKNPTIVMGENCPNSARGDYYLETNPEAPYAQGLKNSAPSTYGNLWPITFVMCIHWFFHLNSL